MALDFLAGCTGGIAGVMVGYPLDTIKVHLQTQDLKNPKYRGTWHCFTAILKKESAWGLYKGMSSPLAGVAVVNAILFGVYGSVQRALPPQWNPSVNVFIAGASAGMVQSVICSPMELAKTRMQLQENDRTTRLPAHSYRSPLDCLRQIHRTEGLRGVYRGYGITLTREVPAFGVYFVSYEWFYRTLGGSEAEPGPLPVLLAGGLSGVSSWVLTYPIDLVKSRVQTDGFMGPRRYKGTLDCFVQSYRSEGPTAFTRGLNSTIIRAFPTNAATFMVVSLTFRLCGPLEATADAKDRKLEELQPRRLVVHSKPEDVGKISDLSRLATYAEATFW